MPDKIMLIIKCAKCNSKIFKYEKAGKGRVLNCWFDRIKKDYSVTEDENKKCKCGSVIGTIGIKGVKMKQGTFTESGTRVN
ncbi:MAG: hypothetical protein JEY94_06470 [Melioribacteraceae bacterium]|nr:hypothetical protein [Melioribacteraceae bacterium]